MVSSVSQSTPVPPWRISSCTIAPASGLPETPENASEPPHCSAIRRPVSGSSVRTSASTRVEPAAHDRLALRQPGGQAAADAEEGVRHVVERKPVLAHERLAAARS